MSYEFMDDGPDENPFQKTERLAFQSFAERINMPTDKSLLYCAWCAWRERSGFAAQRASDSTRPSPLLSARYGQEQQA